MIQIKSMTLGEFNMNKKMFLSSCTACLLGLFGCASTYSGDTECTGPNCDIPADFVCQNTNDPSLCPQNNFINYTRTAADFRQYGERTPSSQLIS